MCYNTDMNNERTWYIYVLKDPRYDTVRYVGWSYDVEQRISAHISSAPKIKSHKAHWIRQLLSLGLRPIIEVIEFGDGDWQEAERRWIRHYRENGASLTNMTNGGDGTPGCYPNEETRNKMAKAHTGRKQSPESIAKTRAAVKGRKQSDEHKANHAATLKRLGIKPIKATEAAAKVNRGKKQSVEHIAKRIAPLTGKPNLKARKLNPNEVREIRAAAGKETQRALAKKFGVGVATINDVIHRLRYSDIPDLNQID